MLPEKEKTRRTRQPTPTHSLESKLDRLGRLQHNIRVQPRMLAAHIIPNRLEPLKQPHKRVPHLRQRKLLADADPRPAIERDVLPRLGGPRLPALGDKGRRVREARLDGRVQVGAALHDERRVADGRALGNRNGLRAVGPAADRQRRVRQRDADVVRHHGVQAQRLVHDVLQVLHVLEVLVRRGAVAADVLHDLGAQRREHGGLLREVVQDPGQGAGGGVAAREERRDELVAQRLSVPGVGRDGVEEGVAFVVVGFFFEFLRREGEGLVDVHVHEVVQHAERRVETHSLAGHCPVERPGDGMC